MLDPSMVMSAAALVVSLLVALLTFKMFYQKSGMAVRGRVVLSLASRATSMTYVRRIVLENQKDKSVTIFGIYADLRGRCILEVESLSDEPLVLEPYGAMVRKYDPPDVYFSGGEAVGLNDVFSIDERDLNVVLSTSEGKYIVRQQLPLWEPFQDISKQRFKNLIKIDRLTLGGKSYGSSAVYLVNFLKDGLVVDRKAIYPGEHLLPWFREYGGGERNLTSAEQLKAMFDHYFLQSNSEDIAVQVIDLADMRISDYGALAGWKPDI